MRCPSCRSRIAATVILTIGAFWLAGLNLQHTHNTHDSIFAILSTSKVTLMTRARHSWLDTHNSALMIRHLQHDTHGTHGTHESQHNTTRHNLGHSWHSRHDTLHSNGPALTVHSAYDICATLTRLSQAFHYTLIACTWSIIDNYMYSLIEHLDCTI